jgi:hypothetical protein
MPACEASSTVSMPPARTPTRRHLDRMTRRSAAREISIDPLLAPCHVEAGILTAQTPDPHLRQQSLWRAEMNPKKPIATLAVPIGPTDHAVGPLDASVTVIEYGDFECPSCAAAEPRVRQLLKLYAAEIRFVFRHFPLEDAPAHTLVAAEAAEAAGAQGKFWPMHDLLLANASHLTRRHLEGYAARIGLELPRFRVDLDERAGMRGPR